LGCGYYSVALSLFIALLVLYVFIPVSRAEVFATIYIKSDGSIETDPPGLHVNLSGSGGLYYLTGDVYGRIVIERDNVVLDGGGFRLYGLSYGRRSVGVQVYGRRNITIINLKIDSFHEGIGIANSSDVRVVGNVVIGGNYGVVVDGSDNLLLKNNAFYNTFVNGVLLSNSSLIEFSFNVFTDCYVAFEIYSSSSVTIVYNVIQGNKTLRGLYLYSVKNTTIAHNVIKGRQGLFIHASFNNSIYNNLFDNIDSNYVVGSGRNNWCIQPIRGVNIIGGDFIGGNAYLLPGNNGYSQTCSDRDGDGFCDQPLEIDYWNIDYHPLKYLPSKPPSPSLIIYTTTHTTTQTITEYITQTTTSKPETITSTVTEIRTQRSVETSIIQLTTTETQTSLLTTTSITTHVYTLNPTAVIVTSISLVLAMAALSAILTLIPGKKH
jgi:parallel beta-helix repeat protein